ncbi:MAG: DivIVA domain-containing protein [Actinomycetota bacterium]|nr:DivIVA domain-containing protein [Actinomycetota bacterium]
MFTPEEIATRQFLIALRGYDRDEVTTFLGRVAEDYRSLVTRVQELETDLERASTAFTVSSDPLEAFRQLGEETTRILVAAEEAAIQLRQRAEEETRVELEAARRTATEELDTARRSAAEELQHARRTAAEELQSARRTAAEELDEARRAASEELEQAHRSAQETIAAANRHRAEVADIVRELQDARQRLADDLASAVQSVEAAVVRLRSGPLGEAAAAALAAAQEPTTVESPGPGPAVAAEAPTGVEPLRPGMDGVVEASHAPSPTVDQASPDLVVESAEAPAQPQASSAAETVPSVDVEQSGEVETPSVTAEAMESLRGGTLVEPAPVEERAEAQPEGEQPAEPGVAEAASHELRDQALAGVRPGMLRRLKRTLQDVQNGVVDALRRSNGRVDPSELPPFADDLAPLGSIGEAFLAEAYRTGIGDGATLAGVPRREDAADPARVDDAARAFRDTLAYEIDASLEATLRAGIEAGEETSMLIERVDGIFRDLKGPVSEAAVDASLVRVYELGLQDLWRATGVETRVWVVGEEQRCPENRCQQNAERGPVALDEQFPSGDYVPPAHPGCTCTIAPG